MKLEKQTTSTAEAALLYTLGFPITKWRRQFDKDHPKIEKVFDKTGRPVIDQRTGQQKERAGIGQFVFWNSNENKYLPFANLANCWKQWVYQLLIIKRDVDKQFLENDERALISQVGGSADELLEKKIDSLQVLLKVAQESVGGDVARVRANIMEVQKGLIELRTDLPSAYAAVGSKFEINRMYYITEMMKIVRSGKDNPLQKFEHPNGTTTTVSQNLDEQDKKDLIKAALEYDHE